MRAAVAPARLVVAEHVAHDLVHAPPDDREALGVEHVLDDDDCDHTAVSERPAKKNSGAL